MAKSKFLDLIGLSTFKDKIVEMFKGHTSDNNIHTSSEEKENLSQAYSHSTSTHAPTDAEKNIIVGVQKNGEDLSVNESSRKVNIVIPTKVSELENDSKFVTESGANTTYELKKVGSEITLVGSDGSETSVTDENTVLEVDEELSDTSTNPVQNKVVKEALDKITAITTDKIDSLFTS